MTNNSVPLVKPTRVWLKDHPTLNEAWVQERIVEDPTILGLGEVEVKDKERLQPGGGRLDVLLHDYEDDHRYEVEIQLGRTDESHIIRTIEYWDIERTRYPAYEHTAVIVAEDITSRFHNVISLFNHHIPIIAIQMSAHEVEGKYFLLFTKVLDERQTSAADDRDIKFESADRKYWEERGVGASLAIADRILELTRKLEPTADLNFTRHYVGSSLKGEPNNYLLFYPRKKNILFCPRMEKSPEIDSKIENTDLDLIDYHSRESRYRLRVTMNDVEKHGDVLEVLLKAALDAAK